MRSDDQTAYQKPKISTNDMFTGIRLEILRPSRALLLSLQNRKENRPYLAITLSPTIKRSVMALE